jgi:hypothetical protein
MFSEKIVWKDKDDVEHTTECWFDLGEDELMELQFKGPGGWDDMMNRMIENSDYGSILKAFKELIILSYGELMPGGEGLEKRDQGRTYGKGEWFVQTFAFKALFRRLFTEPGYAANFASRLQPKGLEEFITKIEATWRENAPQEAPRATSTVSTVGSVLDPGVRHPTSYASRREALRTAFPEASDEQLNGMMGLFKQD